MSTGSEVQYAVAAHEKLVRGGNRSRVVSLPSFELFNEQPASYRNEVLPPAVTKRIASRGGHPAVLGPVSWAGRACSLGSIRTARRLRTRRSTSTAASRWMRFSRRRRRCSGVCGPVRSATTPDRSMRWGIEDSGPGTPAHLASKSRHQGFLADWGLWQDNGSCCASCPWSAAAAHESSLLQHRVVHVVDPGPHG